MGPGPALVGRPAELATLDALLLSVSRGRGTALAVVGEAGIGKSRLLAELGERADALGMLVLSGAASEFEQDLPFWAFVDALDDYVRSLPPARLTTLDDDARSELAHVLPSWPVPAQAASGEDRRVGGAAVRTAVPPTRSRPSAGRRGPEPAAARRRASPAACTPSGGRGTAGPRPTRPV